LFTDVVLFVSLAISLGAYVTVSEREGSYLNILTPSFLIGIPAYYLLPLFFTHFVGNDASTYAYCYVYATIATENLAFTYAYLRPTRRLIRLPFRFSYHNFRTLALLSLGLGFLMYLPILAKFPEYILSPRQFYEQTRTGFGVSFYISSTLAYLAVIFIQFSECSRRLKWSVILAAFLLLTLHGSKGQIMSLLFLLALYEVYVHRIKARLVPSLIVIGILSVLMLALFAFTMSLDQDPVDALQAISEYSDYTRNGMLVIDSHFPLQYGRLTLEGHVFGRIPRVLMPSKPKTFGALYLDEQFFPGSIDRDTGAPDFGMGVQYADFGAFAIVYLVFFAVIRGWLARVFILRLRATRHPADFLMVAFLANVSVFPVGGVGWLLPETLLAAIMFRSASCVGARKIYHERIAYRRYGALTPGLTDQRFGGPLID
jgi:hypothetical protein